MIKEEEEEKEEGEVVELSDSEDDFEVFNQPLSPEITLDDLGHSSPIRSNQQLGDNPNPNNMGIQCKPKTSLLDLIESQLGKDAPGKATQNKPSPPQPTLPFRLEPADLKRKRESKGKEVVETGKTHPS